MQTEKQLFYQEQFIRKSKEKFGDLFDYSKVHYTKSLESVTLICKKHNYAFEISPYRHLRYSNGGCIYCEKEPREEENKSNEEKRFLKIIEKIKNKFKESNCNFEDAQYVENSNYNLITFKCNKHEEVTDRVERLLRSSTHEPCPKCVEEKYSSRFFEKAKRKFGDLLDFSNSKYTRNDKPIEFICKYHGLQKSSPSIILRSSYGCPECAEEARLKKIREYRLTTEEFVKRALSIPEFAEKYDYSETEYINSNTKVKVFCKKCNEYFWTDPGQHLSLKHGHDRCSGAYRRTAEEFKKELEDICGDSLDFSLSVFKTRDTPVEIVCKKEGHHFWRKPDSILTGNTGCPYCNGTHVKTTKEYIDFLQRNFGDEYDFSKVVYINRLTPVKIICKKHGEFERTPASILDVLRTGRESLCTSCNKSSGERKIEKFLLNKNIRFIPQFKFPECKLEKELLFDFYLPDYNLCIEYQGVQHYKPIKSWGGEEYFIKNQLRDQIKRDFCTGNNISLIEVKYNIPLNEIEDRLNLLFNSENLSSVHILMSI